MKTEHFVAGVLGMLAGFVVLAFVSLFVMVFNIVINEFGILVALGVGTFMLACGITGFTLSRRADER